MPWKTLCGFRPNRETVSLLVPYGAWRPDTVITDTEGYEYYVLLDQKNEMRSFEAIFADLDGRRLVCVKRHLQKAFWKDGYYFCTYQPNYTGQRAFAERDMDGKKIYPHSYVKVEVMKGRFSYMFVNDRQQFTRPRLHADNPWFGFMMVCCTPLMRCGKFTARFKKKNLTSHVFCDMWRNTVKVAPRNDVLAALCMAYIFDKCKAQPMVTMFGEEEYNYDDDFPEAADDVSIESHEDDENKPMIEMENMPKDDDDDVNDPPEDLLLLEEVDDEGDGKKLKKSRSKKGSGKDPTTPELV